MYVRAKTDCFVQGRRRKGAKFHYDLEEGAALPPYLEPVGESDPEPETKVPEDTGPSTLSELAAQGSKVVDDPQTLRDLSAAEEPDIEPDFLR